jgi:hypothetical protein
MMKNIFLTTVIALFGVLQGSAQSPWNENQGHGFFKLSQSVIVSDDFYNAEGNIIPIKTSGVYITGLYGQYGLTDRLTGFLYFPFLFRNTINEQEQVNSGVTEAGDASNSIGDTDVGIAYGVIQNGPLVLNASLTLGLPVGETAGGDSEVLQSGDGEFNQLIKLNAGYSFASVPVYAAASIGYNNRSDGFSDEFHASLEAGLTIKQRLTAALKLYNLSSFENGDVVSRQNGLFSNNLEYLAIGTELNYAYTQNWGLSFSFRGAGSGQNILASPSYALGLYYDF